MDVTALGKVSKVAERLSYVDYFRLSVERCDCSSFLTSLVGFLDYTYETPWRDISTFVYVDGPRKFEAFLAIGIAVELFFCVSGVSRKVLDDHYDGLGSNVPASIPLLSTPINLLTLESSAYNWKALMYTLDELQQLLTNFHKDWEVVGPGLYMLWRKLLEVNGYDQNYWRQYIHNILFTPNQKESILALSYWFRQNIKDSFNVLKTIDLTGAGYDWEKDRLVDV